MKKIRMKKLVLPSIIVLIILLLAGWFLFDRYINEPTRVVESMLTARTDFNQKPKSANKFFEAGYLDKIDLGQGATQTPAHRFTISSSNGRDVVTMSFSQPKGEQIKAQTEIVKFNLNKHGVYPLLYWTRITNVELVDIRYASTFANILPTVKKNQTKLAEKFTLSGRFDVSLENFKSIDGETNSNQIRKYSFDIKYLTKPLDFHALTLAVSLLGENDMTCVKSQKVEVSDITKDSQNIKMTVFGDWCNPKSILIDGVDIDSVNVSIK